MKDITIEEIIYKYACIWHNGNNYLKMSDVVLIAKEWASLKQTPSNEVGKWQLCPKCNGDGDLARYNSPNLSTGIPICDVCHGAKILPTPIPIQTPCGGERVKELEAELQVEYEQVVYRNKVIEQRNNEIVRIQEDKYELRHLLSKIVGSMALERVERFDLNEEAKQLLNL